MVAAAACVEFGDSCAVSARRSTYLIAGRRLETGSQEFAEAVAGAYERHERPRCLCLAEGVEMYIARFGAGYIVKRMPASGSCHAPDCSSYEPPPEASGLGQVLGSAITEDPASGETTLRLDFSLSKISGRSSPPPSADSDSDSDSAASSGTKLSLRGLLHYLWDQAELTRWQPGFTGKRNWAAVRRHVLQAAEHKIARGHALRERLYVPEVFSVEERDAINARRLALWQHVVAAPAKPQHLMLLIGEVKEIVPARYGFKAVVKHMPDQAFAIDEPLYRLLGRRFESALALWGAADDIHMVMIATFGVGGAGIAAIHELCLMPVTRQWLPVEDGFEAQLVERLVSEGRAFVKGLRYNLGGRSVLASATLTDCDGSAPLLFVLPAGSDGAQLCLDTTGPSAPAWVWHKTGEPMPPLPQSARRSVGSSRPLATHTAATSRGGADAICP